MDREKNFGGIREPTRMTEHKAADVKNQETIGTESTSGPNIKYGGNHRRSNFGIQGAGSATGADKIRGTDDQRPPIDKC